jgi:hypothetical protein
MNGIVKRLLHRNTHNVQQSTVVQNSTTSNTNAVVSSESVSQSELPSSSSATTTTLPTHQNKHISGSSIDDIKVLNLSSAAKEMFQDPSMDSFKLFYFVNVFNCFVCSLYSRF